MTTDNLGTTDLSAQPAEISTGDEFGSAGIVQHEFSFGPLASHFDDFTDAHQLSTPVIGIYRNGHERSELETRYRRARATALMDPACLFILDKFEKRQYIDVQFLEELISGPAGWLKLCLLVKADLVEIIGSDLRITDEGNTALTENKRISESSKGA